MILGSKHKTKSTLLQHSSILFWRELQIDSEHFKNISRAGTTCNASIAMLRDDTLKRGKEQGNSRRDVKSTALIAACSYDIDRSLS